MNNKTMRYALQHTIHRSSYENLKKRQSILENENFLRTCGIFEVLSIL